MWGTGYTQPSEAEPRAGGRLRFPIFLYRGDIMNIEQLIKLVDAGFTKNEIAAIIGGGGAPLESETEPATATAQEPATATAQEPAPAPATAQEPDFTAAINQRIEQLDNLIRGLQTANIVNVGNKQPMEREQPENILASIIAPNVE